MARFNTTQSTISVTGATTLTYVIDKSTILLTGGSGYTLTLANPVPFAGSTQSIYNATGGVVYIATPNGNLKGNGFTATTSQTIPNNTTYAVTSDGTDYVITNNQGGPISVTAGTFDGTLTANSTVTLSPANANVAISPTGTGTVTISPAGVITINPTTKGAIDNVDIGATTAGSAKFTSATASTATPAAPGVSSTVLTRKDYVDLNQLSHFILVMYDENM